MQTAPLLTSSILLHAARHHGRTEIVSRLGDGSLHRTDYATVETRARALMDVLWRLGARPGERVATLAWNSFRHLELYYAIAGAGAVCHTVNPRLAVDDIAYILTHADDEIVFADPDFLPLLERVLPLAPRIRCVVVLAGEVPGHALGVEVLAYEALMAGAAARDWPELDERAASGLCYTSGTTGRPKGVLYSHRSTVLHAMAVNAADVFGLRAVDRVLPAVPMFHVNAWGMPYAAPMAGVALVLPGRFLDGASLHALMTDEAVTIASGVPTVWLGLLRHLRETGGMPGLLRRLLVGGASCPRLLFEAFDAYGVTISHAWGMTETSPVVTCSAPTGGSAALDGEAAQVAREKVGRVLFGTDLRAVDEAGREVPWDGTTQGHIECRGHWVAERYYGQPPEAAQEWLATGDVGTMDEMGLVALTDRTKDLIKSGGEWISSIQLENIAVSHPAVAEAAVIAARHAKWEERPLLIVVAKPGCAIDSVALLALYDGRVPAWWRPDAVLVLDELPHGATGKIQKSVLRARHGDHLTR